MARGARRQTSHNVCRPPVPGLQAEGPVIHWKCLPTMSRTCCKPILRGDQPHAGAAMVLQHVPDMPGKHFNCLPGFRGGAGRAGRRQTFKY